MPAHPSVLPEALNRNGVLSSPHVGVILADTEALFAELTAWATTCAGEMPTFWAAEGWLIPRVMRLGCLLALFLAVRSEHHGNRSADCIVTAVMLA